MPRKVTRERQWTEWVETCTVCGTDFVTNNPTDRLVDHSTVCCDCQRAKGEATERERQKTRIGGAVVIDTCVRHTYGDHAELKGILIRNGDGMLLEIIAELNNLSICQSKS